jgi:cell division protein FtsQ
MRLLSRLRIPRRRAALAICAGVALIALAGGSTWLWQSGALGAVESRVHGIGARNGLTLTQVELEGRIRQSRESIMAALGVARDMPVLDIDLAAAKARLEKLSWVRVAELERRLPDTLFVRITERQPIAFWQRDGKLALIDRDGSVIAADRLETDGPLIVLVGDDAPAHAAALVDMLKIEPGLAARVNAATWLGDRRWNLRFDNGIEAVLPETDPAAAWHRLAGLEQSDRILERDIVSIDLRMPDRLVLRRGDPKAESRALAKDKAT